MRLRAKVGAIVLTAAVLTGGVAGTAMARTTVTGASAGYGIFKYGVGDSDLSPATAYTYSYYQHYSKTHNATVCGAADITCSSTPWTAPNIWAKKDVLKYAFGNRAYWNVK